MKFEPCNKKLKTTKKKTEIERQMHNQKKEKMQIENLNRK